LSDVAGTVVAALVFAGLVVGRVEVERAVVDCGLPHETRKRSIAIAQERRRGTSLHFISFLKFKTPQLIQSIPLRQKRQRE
jgi:hypothetical protein